MGDQQILGTEYTNPVRITNTSGADLTATTISMAISENYDDTPADNEYTSARILERTASWIRAQILVNRSDFDDGVYYQWVKIDSNPEIIPERVATIVIGPTP